MEQRSPFRETTLACPRCRTGLSSGEPSYCGRCEGAWISEQALVERVATMQQAPAQLEWAVDTRAAIACAACHEPMKPLVVFGVPIDRCRPHGFWFDRDELAQVLHASSQVPRAEPRPDAKREESDGAWLGEAGFELAAHGVANAAIVGADVAVGAAPAAAAEIASIATVEAASGAAGIAVETAGEVAVEAAGGILEAIGELLGGLL